MTTVVMAAADATITVVVTALVTATAATVEAIATMTVVTVEVIVATTVAAVATVMSMLHQGAPTVTIVDTADVRRDVVVVAAAAAVATATTVPQEVVLLMPTPSLPPLRLPEAAALVATMMTGMLVVKALTDLQDSPSAILMVTTGGHGWKIGMATKLAPNIWQPLACSFISWVQRSK